MAKKATAKAAGGGGSKTSGKSKSSSRAVARTSERRSSGGGSGDGFDPVDALIKLLQSPLVIDLLAVGATAALAAITESRTSRAQGAVRGNNSKVVKAAGKAAAAAVGRRLATEFEEIRTASKRTSEGRKASESAGA